MSKLAILPYRTVVDIKYIQTFTKLQFVFVRNFASLIWSSKKQKSTDNDHFITSSH